MKKYITIALLLVGGWAMADCPTVTVQCINPSICQAGKTLTLPSLSIPSKGQGFKCVMMYGYTCNMLAQMCNATFPTECQGNCAANIIGSNFFAGPNCASCQGVAAKAPIKN